MTLGDYTKGVRAGSNDFAIVETFEFRETVMEEEFLSPNRSVTVFAHEDIGNALPFGVLVIHIFAIDEHNDISVLLDRAALAEVGQHRNRRLPGFYRTTELRQRDNRHVELLGQGFQRA